jgi:hypothetical protein
MQAKSKGLCHTPAETLAKDEAREAAEDVIRPFVGQWLAHNAVRFGQ